MKVMNPEIT